MTWSLADSQEPRWRKETADRGVSWSYAHIGFCDDIPQCVANLRLYPIGPWHGPWSQVKDVGWPRAGAAAFSIDQHLGGSGNIDEVLAPVAEGIPVVGRIENFAQRQRGEMPLVAPAERIRGHALVELGFTDEAGNDESKRCMGCDLRFAVSRMIASPERQVTEVTV